MVRFGQPLDSPLPPHLAPGRVTRYWGATVEMVAAGLGLEIDEMVETVDRLATEESLNLAIGSIGVGTVASLRFEVKGFVNGNR